MIVICDIDGTIADISHRLHHIEKSPKDWDAFYESIGDDKPIMKIRELLYCLAKDGGFHAIYYISGRREEMRSKTVQWLDLHSFPTGPLFLRKDGDRREDCIVKREILHEMIYRGAGMTATDILFVLDDRSSVVKMWREEGLMCLQVRDGDY